MVKKFCAVVFAVLFLFCFSTYVFSQDVQPAADGQKENVKTWQLSSGTKFSVWTSAQNKSDSAVFIWTDLRGYRIQYKIAGPGSRNEWQSLGKIPEIKSEASAILGAKESLTRGRFILAARVEVSAGRFEEFESILLNVE